jgi:hypothetical protein
MSSSRAFLGRRVRRDVAGAPRCCNRDDATRIVTTHYRYKPPPKRKTAPLAGPAVVTPKQKPTVAKKLEPAAAIVRKAKPGNDNRPDPAPLPTDGKKSAIVTVKRKPGRFGDVPDLPPEEHQRRGDAAVAVWRELVRRATGKDRP